MPESNERSTTPSSKPASLWRDLEYAAAILAVGGPNIGGVRLIGQPGPVRDYWLEHFEDLTKQSCRRVPSNTAADRLLGGLDIPETIRAGAPVLATGVLAECHGRTALLTMAERLPQEHLGIWCTALDQKQVTTARDGITQQSDTHFSVIALDEGIDDEATPAALNDRLGLTIDIDPLSIRDVGDSEFTSRDINTAKERALYIPLTDKQYEAIALLADRLGINSPRKMLQAAAVVKIVAALDGKKGVDDESIQTMLRLVLLPHATQLPQSIEEPQEAPPEQPEVDEQEQPETEQRAEKEDDEAETLIESSVANLPADLLATLVARAQKSRQRQTRAGKAGAVIQHKQRGRPVGSRRGDIRRGERLDIAATLRTAAPFQRIRSVHANDGKEIVRIESDDIRVKRFQHRKSSVMIFGVDASGSSAHQRMSEAKGAIELLLADCYTHRTEVALIAFKGDRAELLLPPTRSLVRAKRALSQLPGGGGTPMAAAIESIELLSLSIENSGATPSYVLVTDGAANVSRDGTKSRSAGSADALTAAKSLARRSFEGILVDTAVRPSSRARDLANALESVYLPLPNASAHSLNSSIRVLQGQ